jgi:hypothetical protein
VHDVRFFLPPISFCIIGTLDVERARLEPHRFCQLSSGSECSLRRMNRSSASAELFGHRPSHEPIHCAGGRRDASSPRAVGKPRTHVSSVSLQVRLRCNTAIPRAPQGISAHRGRMPARRSAAPNLRGAHSLSRGIGELHARVTVAAPCFWRVAL